jgi:hypothetical protein
MVFSGSTVVELKSQNCEIEGLNLAVGNRWEKIEKIIMTKLDEEWIARNNFLYKALPKGLACA